MPLCLKARPCILCGAMSKNVKYCDKCYVMAQAKIMQEHGRRVRNLAKCQIKIIPEGQSDLSRDSFAWDNPNDNERGI